MKYFFLAFSLSLLIAFNAHAEEGTNTTNDSETPETYAVANLPSDIQFSSNPKNIILLIGDGMGVSQVFSAITANKGKINMSQMPYVGFSLTQSADQYITDSGAGGTALSTGYKTYNGAIGVDVNGDSIPTILEIAEQNGLATGLISTATITHATPASFIAHQPQRTMYEEIAADFLKVDIDVFIGGGMKYFTTRTDERNLITELEQKNYQVFNSLQAAAGVENGPLAILTAQDHNNTYPERGELLTDATQMAINLLKKQQNGFFMMVEGSMIDWGGHDNITSYIVKETLDFDRAIGKALEFAADNKETLVIVTADHETGGLSIVGGNMAEGKVSGRFSSGDHTAVMVPVFAYGAGAENFAGTYQNTEIFKKMADLLGFVVNTPNSPMTGKSVILGTPQVGEWLEITQGTLDDADGLGTFSYQWTRDYDWIDGATNSTYLLTEDDINAIIRCTISYTDGRGFDEVTSSANRDKIGPIEVATQAKSAKFINSTLLYPNPFSDKFAIDLGKILKHISVKIHTDDGKLIQEKNFNNTRIISLQVNADAGIYFVTVNTKDKKEVFKVTKE